MSSYLRKIIRREQRGEIEFHCRFSKCAHISVVIFTFLCLFTSFHCVSARYRCNSKNFIRLGNSCYLLSSEIASWQEAHFRCRDHDAQLAVLGTQYEDNTLRQYLNRPEFAHLGRWIGGMWVQDHWVWAAQGIEIENAKSFSSTKVFDLPHSDQWMCLHMDPLHRYRWSNENCIRQLHYVCEAPLTKMGNNETYSSQASMALRRKSPMQPRLS